ncbi:MAG: hypothetical protein IJW24_00400 [Clostridia bacterium]|nr:hypothetical protein [Clostridia bacterium]
MIQAISSVWLVLAQTDAEKKLTVLYILLFGLFLMLLLMDARTKKEWTGPKIVKNTIIVLIFIAAVALLIAYFNL